MGCTYSGHNKNQDGVRSFRVHNVDDQGVELNRGTIEITDKDLVLRQKGKEAIRWPLHGLRRYGFDAELFSFESGRRCAMGPGIYAFKCSHAESLFNLVQDTLQKAGEEAQRNQQLSHGHSTSSTGLQHTSQTRLTSSNMQGGESHGQTAERMFIFNSTRQDGEDIDSDRNGSSHLYVNGLVVEDTGHEYVNTATGRSTNGAYPIDETAALIDFLHNPPGIRKGATRSQVNYAELCMPDAQPSVNSMENLLDENGVGAVHNVERRTAGIDVNSRLSRQSLSAGGFSTDSSIRISLPNDFISVPSQDCILQASDSDVFLPASSNYVNLYVKDTASPAAPAVFDEIPLPPSSEVHIAAQAWGPKPAPTRTRLNRPLVNYIMIDHKAQSNDNLPGNNSPTSPTSCVSLPESPSRKTESYAMIDFDRTAALSNATRPKEDDEGVRKTRHNSTISDMP
ncbi:fibroblast growth factor receptor substrate 2-like isoform X1 [Biomphalaria glabrata]|uniref:Fibroblast growth factor receptor substrate 2-like n=1 Tax=Biomphalaria glabrata TaxID=6526 RepID=A0A9W3ASS7_BIOGL|nr:fibroblast growth factor receptor substrate 2-like [Biomphalaria glabrata]KAI8758926.1 fibroblast growth factor receptor substrate 2-like isoform X1 [Biomphalaria glabrata]